MKFGKKYSNMTVVMAMIQGVIIGVFGIIIIGVILLGTEGRQSTQEDPTEIPTGGPSEEVRQEAQDVPSEKTLTLYAKQHGVFENRSAAETFLQEDSSLSTAAIIENDGNSFVWSAIENSEAAIEELLTEGSFKKTIKIKRKACSVLPLDDVWEILQMEDLAKIKKYEDQFNKKEGPKGQEKLKAILTFTDDVALIKLHLLQDAKKEDCLEISF